MNRNLASIVVSVFTALVLVFLTSTNTVADNASTLKGEEACVPQSVVEEVTTCPGGFKMGEFKKKSTKIGTSTKKAVVKKKKKEATPGIGQNFVKEITENAFSNKRKARALDILKKEIVLIKRLAVQTSDDNPEKGEILKRLADAYKELYNAINFLARGLEEKIFACRQKSDKNCVAQLKGNQKALDKKAREFRELSIRSYVEIRNKFPDYPDYDEILFAIAYEIDQLANELENKKEKSKYREKGRVFYQELIRNYPQSRFIPHAWMAFGEFYFHEAKDVERAMRAYEKVVEWGEKKNPNYIVAIYYQAWCLLNMQENKKAINQFNKVITFSVDNPSNKEAKVVAKRARMEMVSPFSKIGNPSKAWTFFQKVGGDQSHSMLNKLADLYYDDGHWMDAIIVFHMLEKLEIENYRGNNGNDLCKYQTMVTNATISTGDKSKQVVEIKRQIGLSKKFEAEGNHDPVKIKRCNQDTISIAWDTATHWNLEAVGSESAPGTKDEATMNSVVALYETILNAYPNLDEVAVEGFDEKTKPTRYRVAYYTAELYWYMENWEGCAPAFDKVVDMDPQGEYTSDAAYAAVLCYNKIYVRDRSDEDKKRKHQLVTAGRDGQKKCAPSNVECTTCQKQCKGKKAAKRACKKKCIEEGEILAPRELTELEVGILQSYNRYVCFVNDADDLVNIKYRRARIFYEANMFAEASVLFRDIAVNHSTDEVAVYAANLYLDCLNALGSMIKTPIPSCYDDLADIVDLFIDVDKAPGKNLMKDEEFSGQIKALKVGVLRKKAESLTKRGRFLEAAEIYLDIYRHYSEVYDERGMCEVLFNTAINLESARLVMKAINVRQKMIELYPTCEHSKKAAFYIGQNYHALQQFSNAAENYVSFANQYTGEKEAPEAMSNAIMFYIGLGELEKALKTVSSYEKHYKTRYLQQTASVVFSSGYIYEKQGDIEKTRKWYRKYLKRYSKAKHVDEQVQAMIIIGDTYWKTHKRDYPNALKWYKKGIAEFEKNAKSVTENKRKANMLIAVAKAKYYIAERLFIDFKKIRFPEFRGEKGIPKKIEKWWKTQRTPEELEAAVKWRRDRKRLARWGYYDESKTPKEQMKMVKKEERKEDLEIQFNYWAKHKLGPWFEKKIKSLELATAAFAKVTEVHIPEWEMAAAARAADMQLAFMRDIYDSPLPPSMKGDQELIDIYRSTMDAKAKPYRDTAVKLYEYCLNISTKVRWFNENSLRCEFELNKLEPRIYPISEEMRVEPKAELRYFKAPDAILELETESQKREKGLKKAADEVSGEAADGK